MYTVINGFDRTDLIPYDSLNFSASINDPLPSLDFDLYDTGSQLSLSVGMEVIVFDENAPPEPGVGAGTIIVGSSTPASNFLEKTVAVQDAPWATSGPLASLVQTPPGASISMTFNNNALGAGLLQQTTAPGYIQPGQSYMFSAYETLTNLVHAQAILRMEFLDQNGNVLSTVQDLGSSNTTTERIAIQGIAPASTASIRVSMGGQTTQASANSGSLTIQTPQLEPMWFVARGISYPTDDCNYAQAICFRLPDDTMSRSRVYAGYIEDLQVSYDGPNRIYHVACAPAMKTIDNTGLISATYTQAFDDTIIEGIVENNYGGLLSGNIIAPNSSSAITIIRGVEVQAIAYTDQTFREILNSLADQSGYSFYVDPYYQVRYHPAFYDIANFALSDTPDNVTSFAYYDYHLEYDGSQMKQRVKVVGANPTGPQITDLYNGGGAGPFGLSHIPANISSVTVSGTAQQCGITGVNTYSQGYTCLVDPANKLLTFQNATPSGSANVAISYTYQNPVAATVQKLDTVTAQIIAPGYVTPTYDALLNDSSLTSAAAANIRGLAEVSKYGDPLIVIQCKAQQYAAPGTAIYFTSSRDNITNQAFIVQQVQGVDLGNGTNEWRYTLGAYIPTIIDHTRNIVKAMNRSVSVGNVTTSLQTDLATSETIAWSETITHTP